MKCDESEPYCQRCVSTGRKCDGVRAKKVVHFLHENHANINICSPSTVPHINSHPWLIDSAERHVFGFYLQQVAPVLSGSLDEGLWKVIVPQLAHDDDAVKFSILAISDFFAHPVKTPQHGQVLSKVVSRKHLQALKWYGRALAVYRRNDFTVFRSDLLAKTVMFVSLEIQQNNIAAGLRLLKLAFTMVAPLLTAGCVDCSFRAAPDSITETILPIFMRSAGMLFTPWSELHDRIKYSSTSAELVEIVFWTLCMIWTLWKDFYLLHQTDAESAWPQLEDKHSELEDILLLAKDNFPMLKASRTNELQQNDVLEDYCTLGLQWLDLMRQIANPIPRGSWSVLEMILSQLTLCKFRASVSYPAAVRTTFFHQMAILPLAYMVAVFANNNDVRNRALLLMDCSLVQSPYTQLHAVLLPSRAEISRTRASPAPDEHSKISKLNEEMWTERNGAGNLFLQTPLPSSTSTVEVGSATDPASGNDAEQSVWLTGDMLHVYPERRIVMTEIL